MVTKVYDKIWLATVSTASFVANSSNALKSVRLITSRFFFLSFVFKKVPGITVLEKNFSQPCVLSRMRLSILLFWTEYPFI